MQVGFPLRNAISYLITRIRSSASTFGGIEQADLFCGPQVDCELEFFSAVRPASQQA
jgi:hypothetical protein